MCAPSGGLMLPSLSAARQNAQGKLKLPPIANPIRARPVPLPVESTECPLPRSKNEGIPFNVTALPIQNVESTNVRRFNRLESSPRDIRLSAGTRGSLATAIRLRQRCLEATSNDAI